MAAIFYYFKMDPLFFVNMYCEFFFFLNPFFFSHQLLNVRYKGKSYRATVEIVRTADRVADFCRKTCIKLECCPNLFGPRMVLEHCSENCSVLTKTKYSRWLSDLSSHLLSYHYCQSITCLTSCWWDPNGDRREQLHTKSLLFCH